MLDWYMCVCVCVCRSFRKKLHHTILRRHLPVHGGLPLMMMMKQRCQVACLSCPSTTCTHIPLSCQWRKAKLLQMAAVKLLSSTLLKKYAAGSSAICSTTATCFEIITWCMVDVHTGRCQWMGLDTVGYTRTETTAQSLL